MRFKHGKKENEKSSAREARSSLIAVSAGALCLALLFFLGALIFVSCSASAGASISRGGGAHISIQAAIPSQVAAKMRSLSAQGPGSGAEASFFDSKAIMAALRKHPDLSLISMVETSPTSIQMDIEVKNLESFANQPDIREGGLISLKKGSNWTELNFHLSRDNAKAFAALLPGLDPDFLDAISPPALQDEPVSKADYTTMLSSIFGERSMPAIRSAKLSISITAPGPVSVAEGGELTGSTLNASIPILDLVTLEKPVDLRLRWN